MLFTRAVIDVRILVTCQTTVCKRAIVLVLILKQSLVLVTHPEDVSVLGARNTFVVLWGLTMHLCRPLAT